MLGVAAYIALKSGHKSNLLVLVGTVVTFVLFTWLNYTYSLRLLPNGAAEFRLGFVILAGLLAFFTWKGKK